MAAVILNLVLIAAAAAVARTQGTVGATRGFLDLTAEEIKTTVRLAAATYPIEARPSLRYPVVIRDDPPKASVLSTDPQAPNPSNWRRSYALALDLSTNRLSKVTVDLKTERVISKQEFPDGTTSRILDAEIEIVRSLVLTSPEWNAAMKKRGLDTSRAEIRVTSSGPLPLLSQGPEPGRFLRGLTYYRDGVSRFWYWTPVEGLQALVNLRAGSVGVVTVWDDGNATTLATPIKEVQKPTLSASVQPLKPLYAFQPNGTSIIVRGQDIDWYKWKFSYSVGPIYGLKLHQVSYAGDCGQPRNVLYQLYLGEIFVPYTGEGRTWRWRAPFDAGYYGAGIHAVEQRRGVDVPNNAALFQCVVADEKEGVEPKTVPGCVAAYELDTGLLYKYVDFATGDAEARRGRALVLQLTASFGNYDYIFQYILYQDGSIHVRTRLTGIIQPRGVATKINDPNCLTDCVDLLNNYIVGPIHQHFFTYHVDLDVDGAKNQVLEVDVTPDGTDGAFSSKKRLLSTETPRDFNPRVSRSWHVVNTGSRNRFASPRGYALIPLSYTVPYLTPASRFYALGAFAKHQFWVTRHRDDEQSPGATFPRSNIPYKYGDVGLPNYVADQESTVDEDVVAWYTFGVTHQTRPEEWPIMNVHDSQGFILEPFNFMSQNGEMNLEEFCP